MFLKLLIIGIALGVFAYALALAFQGTLTMVAMFELPGLVFQFCVNLYHSVLSMI
jgi:hypothetical protein